MRTLMLVVVLLLIGIAGVGYCRGWFAFSTNGTDATPSATITVDKNKFHEDEQKARDEVQGLGQEAKKKVGDLSGKAKEPQPQP
ncbi:MAG: hypothetical protein ACLP9L_17240 [Thermoguttaceae bacterium]